MAAKPTWGCLVLSTGQTNLLCNHARTETAGPRKSETRWVSLALCVPLTRQNSPRLLCVASASARDGEVVGSWTSDLTTSSMMGMTAGESLLRFRRFGSGAVRGYVDTFHYFPHHGIMGPLYHSVSTILTSIWDIQDADFSIFNIQGEKAIGFLN